MNLAQYGRRLFGYTSLGIILIGLLNAVVDPYLYLDLLSIDGLNAERISLINKRSRVAKAAILKHCPKQVLIFGSSRSQVGLREDLDAYNGRSVYNASLEGSNIFEIKHAISFATNYQQPETVIIGLDFEAFTDSRTISADFMDSDFSSMLEGRNIVSYLRYLLSPQTLAASWNTIKANNASELVPSLCSSTGHLNLSKQAIDHRRAFTHVVSNMLVKPGAYPAFRYSKQRLDMFEEAITLLYKEDTDVLLFFSPSHVRQTEVIRGLGLYDSYEQWKSDVFFVLEKINAKSSGNGRLEVWDFSNYSDITTETVPALGSDIKMKWYRESSHYSRVTGDLLLNRLLSDVQSDSKMDIDFGQKMSVGMMKSHFATDRDAAKRYAEKNPNEIKDVLELIQRTKKERERVERSSSH